MASNQACAPSTIHSATRRHQAATLRQRGYPYHKIGSLMGCTKQTAWKLVQEALTERRAELDESIQDIRSVEVARYDDLTKRMFKRLDDPTNPDPEKTVQSILRISERRSRLLGLDAPQQFGFVPGGSNAIAAGGDVDVSKLTTEQLRELEDIQVRYEALKTAAPLLQLPAGEPVAVVPEPDRSHDTA